MRSLVLLTVVVVILWLVQLVFLLFLDSPCERSVVVVATVVSNAGVPPEVVDTPSASNDVGVVNFVVVADPAADHAPHGLDGRVTGEATNLWLLASYNLA